VPVGDEEALGADEEAAEDPAVLAEAVELGGPLVVPGAIAAGAAFNAGALTAGCGAVAGGAAG
jgi:hypothetical protein